MRDPLPTDLVRALAARGLRLTGPVGVGSSGPRWGAVATDGSRVTVTVLPPVAGPSDPITRRLVVLDRLRHPGLAGVTAVLRLPGGRAALCPEVPGADLVTVGTARGPWGVGEVVTLVGAVAEALAVLHGAGIAHGDVAPGNIVLRSDGLPVLVDLLGGGHEAGTPGFAAPERATGAATAAGDVHALGALGRHLLGPGAPDRLRALLAEAMDPDPARRPLAAELARRVTEAAPAGRIMVPEPGVLAVAGLRRLAGDRSDAGVTVRRPARSKGRHRRRGRSGVVLTAVVGVLGLGVTIALTTGGVSGGTRTTEVVTTTVGSGTSTAAAADTPGATTGRSDPRTAAVRLTADRARALVTGDRAALTGVTVPGSPAARADRLTATRLGRVPSEPTAVRLGVGEVSLVASPPAPGSVPGRGVRVRIAAHATTGDPSSDPPSVVVVLRAGSAGWRVSAVEP